MTATGGAVRSVPPLRRLIVCNVAASLIDHRLRARGQGISSLPGEVRRFVERNERQRTLPATWRLVVSTINELMRSDRDFMSSALWFDADGGGLDLPPLFCSLTGDAKGDVTVSVDAMMLGGGVIYRDTTRRKQRCLVEAQLLMTGNLPETMLIAARGRPLAEVISHPGLDDLPLGMTDVANLPDGETLCGAGPRIGARIDLEGVGLTILPFD